MKDDTRDSLARIDNVIRAVRRVIRNHKRRRLYGPTPTPEEEKAVQKIGDIMKSMLDGHDGAFQDGKAELAALIHYNAPPEDEEDAEDDD